MNGSPPDDGSITSLTDAADIIKIIDSAVTEASTSAVTAASEVEEARRNARAASEVARRFMALGGQQHNLHLGKEFGFSAAAVMNGSFVSPRRLLRISPRSPLSINGDTGFRVSSPHSGSSIDQRRRKNGGASDERVINSYTEELVSLSIELDRAKHALETEQMKHDETKSALTQSKLKTSQLEAQMEQLLSDMETQREASGRKLDAALEELAHARMQVEAAEEDANMALELAKDNDERREEAESLLPAALQEIEELKAQLAAMHVATAVARPMHPPPPPPPPPRPPRSATGDSSQEVNKRVRFADSSMATDDRTLSLQTPSPFRLDRSLVASGRALLFRSQGATPLDADNLSIDSLTERRKRLQDRMKCLGEQMSPTNSPSTASLPSPSPTNRNNIESDPSSLSEAAAHDTIRNTAKLLKSSGRRLGLTGRWWNETAPAAASTRADKDSAATTIPLETLTRHYCTSVEVLVDRKQKEVVELESLCALWEQGNTADGKV